MDHVDYTMNEMRLAGIDLAHDPRVASVLKLLKLWGAEDHSGFSASYTLATMARLRKHTAEEAQAQLTALLESSADDDDGNEMQAEINRHLTALLHILRTAPEGVWEIFSKVSMFEPLSPLTGEDSEWIEVYEDEAGVSFYQNNRCPSVFKEGDRAYWSEGIIFRDEHGGMHQSNYSRIPIAFPWIKPEPLVVDDESCCKRPPA